MEVTDYCTLEESTMPQRNKPPENESEIAFHLSELMKKQTYRYPVQKKKLPLSFMPDLIITALENLTRGGMHPAQAPEFIGYIPEEYADKYAAPNGFFDSIHSLFFRHGEYSHLFQLSWMSLLAGMKADDFERDHQAPPVEPST